MHPLSTALFLLGYGLALPIGMRLGHVVRTGHRLALAGHQVGVVIAGVGWLIRGSVAMALVHVAWLVAARLWFIAGAPPRQPGPDAPTDQDPTPGEGATGRRPPWRPSRRGDWSG